MSSSNQSGSSEIALDLDVHFLPAWAQRSPAENQYSKYEGGGEPHGPERRGDRPGWRGPRDRRRDGPPGERKFGIGGPPRRDGRQPFPRGDRYEAPREERHEPPAPPVALNVNLLPEEKGVEALARQIRLTGRAYPLFDIGYLILKKPDRYDVQLSVIKGPDGKPAQPICVCDLDETLWLSEQEAVDHVLSKHFSTFYQTEKIPTDPPKGVYTFVAQCGMSGTIFGPPNYHDYQNKLRKLHQERFARMPFEVFKSRVKIVKDEAVVKKWIEEQSFRLEYTCLNVPETIKLKSRDEVEKHFRETHLANVIHSVESRTLSGPIMHDQANRAIRGLVRRAWEEQNRFPLKLVNTLSQQFAGHGLQFFKFNKNVTYVSVSRPRYLDLEATPVSETVQRIVDFIRNTPRCTRRKLIDALAPAIAPPPVEPPPSDAASTPATDAPAVRPEQSQAAATPATSDVSSSPQFAAINGDLHWLVHEGHVIEFANGILELARRPPPRPPKPERKPPQTVAATATTPVPSEQQLAAGAGDNTDTERSSTEPDADITAEPDGAAVGSTEEEASVNDPAQAEQVNVSADDLEEEKTSTATTSGSIVSEAAAEPAPDADAKAESERMPVQAS